MTKVMAMLDAMASREAAKWSTGQLLFRLCFSMVFGGTISFFASESDGESRLIVAAIGAVLMFLLISGFLDWLVTARPEGNTARTRERVREAEAEFEQALRQRETGSAQAGAEQARLTLSDLWTVTHRRLDHYHGIALGQAAKSFQNAQIAMVIGFLLLIAFAGVGFAAGSTAGSVVAGALGVASAALAGYVSRTFVKSQETAAGHLRAYFDQPLEFSRYLAAERLIADTNLSEEQRAEILKVLVQAMVAGPPVLPTLSDGSAQQPGNTP